MELWLAAGLLAASFGVVVYIAWRSAGRWPLRLAAMAWVGALALAVANVEPPRVTGGGGAAAIEGAEPDAAPCAAADRLLAAGAADEARRLYVSLLRQDDEAGHGCAEAGLRALAGETEPVEDAFVDEVGGGVSNLAARVDDDLELSLGPFAWGVVLLVALLTYRGLEQVASRNRLGPVVVRNVYDAARKAAGEPDEIKAQLRQVIAEAGLTTPGSLPGGEEQSVDDLPAKLAEDPRSSWIGSLLALAGNILRIPRGLVVDATVLSAGGDACHGIAVEVLDARTHTVEGFETFWHTRPEGAAELAGAYAAQRAYARWRRAPRWATYTDPSGGSIAAVVCARRAKHEGDLRTSRQDLERARRLEPANVHVRLALAELDEMEDRWRDAADGYAMAVKANPGLLVARYRGAIALAMAAETDPDGAEGKLRQSLEEISRLDDDLSPRTYAWRTYWPYQTERRPSLTTGRSTMRGTVRTASLVIELRLAALRSPDDIESELASLEERLLEEAPLPTGDDGSHPVGWQAHYNAACFYGRASRLHPAGASAYARDVVAHLHACLRDPSAARQLEAAWVRVDPDLAAVSEDVSVWCDENLVDDRSYGGACVIRGWQAIATAASAAAVAWRDLDVDSDRARVRLRGQLKADRDIFCAMREMTQTATGVVAHPHGGNGEKAAEDACPVASEFIGVARDRLDLPAGWGRIPLVSPGRHGATAAGRRDGLKSWESLDRNLNAVIAEVEAAIEANDSEAVDVEVLKTNGKVLWKALHAWADEPGDRALQEPFDDAAWGRPLVATV